MTSLFYHSGFCSLDSSPTDLDSTAETSEADRDLILGYSDKMVSTSTTGKNVARTINFDSDGDENDDNDQSDQVEDKETSEGEDQEDDNEFEGIHENDYVLLETKEEHKSKQSNIILEGNDMKDTQETEEIVFQDYNIDEEDINVEDNGRIEKERTCREINIKIERENVLEDDVNEKESEHIDEDEDCDQPSATCRFVGSGVPREIKNGKNRWENGWNCFLM